jgi:hypothetical protein
MQVLRIKPVSPTLVLWLRGFLHHLASIFFLINCHLLSHDWIVSADDLGRQDTRILRPVERHRCDRDAVGRLEEGQDGIPAGVY